MTNEVDIIENNLLEEYGQEIFDLLLTDHSMTLYKNDGQTHHIFWATHDYEYLGEGYSFYDEIMAERIGQETRVIIDRREGDWYVGRTEYSSPEVDPEVLIPVSERRLRRGCFYNAKITGAEEFDIYATVI